MNITDIYYDYVVGEYPSEENYHKTENIINHLLDNKIPKNEIIQIILNCPNKDYLTIDDLPDNLWDNSLLKRNTFYYHKELEIISPSPTLEETFPFYLEMKIRYTEEDILNYYIKVFNIREEWINRKKEIGSIKYLLTDYKKFDFIEPVDFILHLIDYTRIQTDKVSSIYDLSTYDVSLAEELEIRIQNAVKSNKNKIYWRK